jgi:hypothetical protein
MRRAGGFTPPGRANCPAPMAGTRRPGLQNRTASFSPKPRSAMGADLREGRRSSCHRRKRWICGRARWTEPRSAMGADRGLEGAQGDRIPPARAARLSSTLRLRPEGSSPKSGGNKTVAPLADPPPWRTGAEFFASRRQSTCKRRRDEEHKRKLYYSWPRKHVGKLKGLPRRAGLIARPQWPEPGGSFCRPLGVRGRANERRGVSQTKRGGKRLPLEAALGRFSGARRPAHSV